MPTSMENNVSTFANDANLPKLPLPDLHTTLCQLKESLEPLYYADGYYQHPLDPQQTLALSESLVQFVKSSAANKLQDKLKEFYEKNDCYLDDIHLDINNVSKSRNINDDILPRNPYLVLMNDVVPDITQVDYAAVLTNSALRFVSALKKGILSPDITKEGNPLAMKAYLNLFGTTRCPLFEKGEVEKFDLNKQYSESDIELENYDDYSFSEGTDSVSEGVPISNGNNRGVLKNSYGITMKQDLDSKHIIVLSKGQYYSVDVLDDRFDRLYRTDSLATLFKYIAEDSNKPESLKTSTALGSLTSHSYKNWKYARKRLLKRYPDQMNLIDTALFIVILDESTEEQVKQVKMDPMNPQKYTIYNDSNDSKRLYYGTSIIDNKGHQIGSCISRWYDKLQLVVTSDSKAAIIWDSFTCDGSTVLRFVSDLYAESILRLAREVNGGDQRFSLWPNLHKVRPDNILLKTQNDDLSFEKYIHKIDWSFSNILNTHIHLSETKLADLISKYDIVNVSIPYGNRKAKRIGVKSDAMIQIALQIAHYALYGKMVYGVEPISTRSFKNSRGSFVNIQNKELLKLCQGFISNSLSEQDKLQKFIHCCEYHSEKVKTTKRIGGYEKHVNALRYLYKHHKQYDIGLTREELKTTSKVFDSELFKPFFNPELIVSNCGNDAVRMFGIRPDIPNGFGVSYIVKDDQSDITVTSQFRQGKRLIFTLDWVLSEIFKYWKISRMSAGIKITPVIDKLYSLDNAKNATNISELRDSLVGKPAINGGYGFFDLDAHLNSRTLSTTNSKNNSSTSLNKWMKKTVSTQNSTIFSGLTDLEKKSTGHEIISLKPNAVTNAEASSPPSSKRKNVISSKFDINFSRGDVGRKLSPTFQ